MTDIPVSVQPNLRRLARRLAIGLFLDVWPVWAVGSLLAAGVIALACRLLFAGAAPFLPWLASAPLVAGIPALVVTIRRAYRREDVVAIADALGGGHGLLLTLGETGDPDWARSPILERLSGFALPRLHPWRRLAPLAPAAAFLAIALWLPQRIPAAGRNILADELAGDLTATLVELKQQQLVTPEEEEQLENEIERIRRAAEERVDASSWEAADALRERIATQLAGKQDAVRWAEESLRRYAAAVAGGAAAAGDAQAAAAELAEALGKLAESGLLGGAPPELQQMLEGGRLPGDAASLGELAGLFSKYLEATNARFGGLAGGGRAFGRFDPAEFALNSELEEGEGHPGRGGLDRGRADAELTWGKESLPLDRFRAEALPPGAPRSADDWAPIVELPGAPNAAPVQGARAAARRYSDSAGGAAWRRTLEPRHQSAVKKYFAEQPLPQRRGGG